MSAETKNELVIEGVFVKSRVEERGGREFVSILVDLTGGRQYPNVVELSVRGDALIGKVKGGEFRKGDVVSCKGALNGREGRDGKVWVSAVVFFMRVLSSAQVEDVRVDGRGNVSDRSGSYVNVAARPGAYADVADEIPF